MYTIIILVCMTLCIYTCTTVMYYCIHSIPIQVDTIVITIMHGHTQLCYDVVCPPLQYEPSKDVLNAAQSGAMVPNLVSHEFKYLLDELEKVQHNYT